MAEIQIEASATLHIGHVSNNEFGKIGFRITMDTDKPGDTDIEKIVELIHESYEKIVAELDKDAMEMVGVQITRADKK